MNDLFLSAWQAEKAASYRLPADVGQKYAESLRDHIRYVQDAGTQLGVPHDQLFNHDQSKYSDEEFPFYARHFFGDKGDPGGYARAFIHHVHNNAHHWQHFLLPHDFEGTTGGVIPMPQNYALEMIADWMGAGRAYNGSWDMTDWLKGNMGRIRLHPETVSFIKGVLSNIGYDNLVRSHKFMGEA